MNLFRAEKIADAFSQVAGFSVKNNFGALSVDYLGSRAFFFDERGFWNFVEHLAHASHEESPVARIEAELAA